MLTPGHGRRFSAGAALLALLFSLVAILGAAPATGSPTGPAGLWSPTVQKLLANKGGHRRLVNPSTYTGYTLNAVALTGLLATAPNENSAAARRGARATISVPAPTGELVDFAVVDSPVMEAPLAVLHPELRTYAGKSVTDGYSASIRLDVTPFGFHAVVSDGRAQWFVDPAYLGDTSLYLSYFGSTLPVVDRLPDELLDPETGKPVTESSSGHAAEQRIGEGANALVKQRVYRLALSTDSTYAEYFAPGLNSNPLDSTASNAAVLAAKVTLINRVNEIYNDDLAIKLVLVAGTDALNFNSDLKEAAAGLVGLDQGCGAQTLAQNQVAVDTRILPTNYDIGHIALGINGGGIAFLGVVGQNGRKAGGCTGLPTPVGDFMAIDYVAHEMGHQFGGPHTFNGTQVNCSGGNRTAESSVEPGSGTSVMAYAGICGSDDLQPHTDPYFSQQTQDDIGAYVNSTGLPPDDRGGNEVITTTNHNPVVTAPDDFTIPVRTPFTLAGSATDADGDDLIYLWEQNDLGGTDGIGLTDNNKIAGPLFRVFGTYADVSNEDTITYHSPGENIATNNPVRTFPDIDQIIAGTTNAATGTCPTPGPADLENGTGPTLVDGPVLDCYSEFLPTAAYVGDADAGNAGPPRLNFRLTARDKRTGGGGTQYDDVTLTIAPSAGPFLVTSQDTPTTYVGGSTQTVAWAVNGTDAPALAPNVKITMSTDGGQTFDKVLAASTPNDGTQSVTIPDTATTQGWIKVEAVGNVFFDLNNAPITVTEAPAGLEVTQPVNPTQSAQYSDPIASVGFSATSGAPGADLAASIDPATPLPADLSLSARTGTSTAASWTITGTADVAPGVYAVTAKVTDGTATTDVPLTFTVTKENATPTYTGPTAKSGPAGAGSVPVTLTATVAQATDGTLGDLSTATATFVDATTSATLCTSAVTAAGVASCSFNADAPKVYAVKVDVGGRFTGTTAGTTALTVTATPATAPDTEINVGPAKWILTTSATYVFSSTVGGSTFACTLDGLGSACASPTTLNGLSRATHVFTVAATAGGSTDPTPARSVTTIPLDDRELTVKAGKWKQRKSKKTYLKTYLQAHQRGAVLQFDVVDARSLALVVSKAKHDGRVKVFLDGVLLKKVSLKGASKRRAIVDLGTFLSPTSGSLTIVTQSKKRVRIDGLGVATAL